MEKAVGEDLPAGTRELDDAIVADQREAEKKGAAEVTVEQEKRPVSEDISSPKTPVSDDSSHSSTVDLKTYDSKIVQIRDEPTGDAAFAHLPEHEQAILKKQVDIPDVAVSFKTLYRYATRWDMFLVGVACFCAIGGGAVMPLMTVREEKFPQRDWILTVCRSSLATLPAPFKDSSLELLVPPHFPTYWPNTHSISSISGSVNSC